MSSSIREGLQRRRLKLMNAITAGALSTAIIGGIATWLALAVLQNYVLIWVIFIAWAGFVSLGGDMKAFRTTLICGLFGVVVGWVAAYMVVGLPYGETLGVPLWAALVVAVTAFTVVIAAHAEAFSAVPVSVLTYAATFAYLMQTQGKLTAENLTSVSFSNPLAIVSLSVIAGAVFGLIAAKLAGTITEAAPQTS
jgi:Protein of unknown function (DUF1097)